MFEQARWTGAPGGEQKRRRIVSIEVQCPNPLCAKVHRVKNRWAGRRGTCPDCGTVIQVPDPIATPPMLAPTEKSYQAPAEADATFVDEMQPQAMDFELP